MKSAHLEIFVSLVAACLTSYIFGHKVGLVALETIFPLVGLFVGMVRFWESEVITESNVFVRMGPSIIAVFIYGFSLYFTTDPLEVVLIESIKFLIFVVMAHLLMTYQDFARSWINVSMAFYIGLVYMPIIHPYEQAENLSEIAKWVAPPAYVLLPVAFGLLYLRKMWMIYALLPVILYGLLFGGARGSILGGIIVYFAMIMLKLAPPYVLRFPLIRNAILIFPMILSAVLPVIFALNFMDIDPNEGDEHTKSNMERTALMTIGYNKIVDSPFIGAGFDAGYSMVLEYFDAYLKGYNPVTSLHNQILDAFFFSGGFGGLSICFIFFTIFSKLWARNLNPVYVPHVIVAILAICMYMAVEPFSSKSRTCDLMVLASISIFLRNAPQNTLKIKRA